MKNILLLLTFILLLASCKATKKENEVTDYFEKSDKEQKDLKLSTEYTEHFDSINNFADVSGPEYGGGYGATNRIFLLIIFLDCASFVLPNYQWSNYF